MRLKKEIIGLDGKKRSVEIGTDGKIKEIKIVCYGQELPKFFKKGGEIK